jgi:hypothetical protein
VTLCATELLEIFKSWMCTATNNVIATCDEIVPGSTPYRFASTTAAFSAFLDVPSACCSSLTLFRLLAAHDAAELSSNLQEKRQLRAKCAGGSDKRSRVQGIRRPPGRCGSGEGALHSQQIVLAQRIRSQPI